MGLRVRRGCAHSRIWVVMAAVVVACDICTRRSGVEDAWAVGGQRPMRPSWVGVVGTTRDSAVSGESHRWS